MSHTFRTLLGLVVAPLAVMPAFLISYLFAEFSVVSDVFSSALDIKVGLAYLVNVLVSPPEVVLWASYIYTLFLGLPLYVVLVRSGNASLVECSIIGALLGLLLGFMAGPAIDALILGVVSGALIAASLRAIAGVE